MNTLKDIINSWNSEGRDILSQHIESLERMEAPYRDNQTIVNLKLISYEMDSYSKLELTDNKGIITDNINIATLLESIIKSYSNQKILFKSEHQ